MFSPLVCQHVYLQCTAKGHGLKPRGQRHDVQHRAVNGESCACPSCGRTLRTASFSFFSLLFGGIHADCHVKRGSAGASSAGGTTGRWNQTQAAWPAQPDKVSSSFLPYAGRSRFFLYFLSYADCTRTLPCWLVLSCPRRRCVHHLRFQGAKFVRWCYVPCSRPFVVVVVVVVVFLRFLRRVATVLRWAPRALAQSQYLSWQNRNARLGRPLNCPAPPVLPPSSDATPALLRQVYKWLMSETTAVDEMDDDELLSHDNIGQSTLGKDCFFLL